MPFTLIFVHSKVCFQLILLISIFLIWHYYTSIYSWSLLPRCFSLGLFLLNTFQIICLFHYQVHSLISPVLSNSILGSLPVLHLFLSFQNVAVDITFVIFLFIFKTILRFFFFLFWSLSFSCDSSEDFCICKLSSINHRWFKYFPFSFHYFPEVTFKASCK